MVVLPLWGFALVLSRWVDLQSLPLWGFDSVLFKSGRLDLAWTRLPAFVPWPLPLWGFHSDWTSREATSVGRIHRLRRVGVGPRPTARGLGREGFDRRCCPSGVSPRVESARLADVPLPLWGFGHLGVAVAPLGFRLLVELPLWGFSFPVPVVEPGGSHSKGVS